MGGGGSKYNQANVDITHFDVQRVIGIGGFGKVKACLKISGEDKDKWYAMKLLDKNIAVKNPIGPSQIMNERNALAPLNSIWIVNSVYCFGDLSFAYIVMDICLGGDLRYRMKKSGGKIKEAQCMFYATQIAFAISYIHSQKMIHCDVKPENVVLDSNGYVKLTDFGFAVKTDEKGESVCIGGTAGYMAPETYCRTRKQGRPADWFSFGISVWEMLTGHMPFDRSNIGCGPYLKNFPEGQHLEMSQWPPFLWGDLDKFAPETGSLLTALVMINAPERLGSADDDDVLRHAAFKDIQSGIMAKTVKPEFLPDITIANVDTGEEDAMESFGAPPPKKITAEQNLVFDGHNYNNEFAPTAKK